MHPLLNIAVRAARRAGSTIVRSLNQLDSIKVSSKGRNDFVSEVDRAAEQEIIDTVRRSYPNHAFLAEESDIETYTNKVTGFYGYLNNSLTLSRDGSLTAEASILYLSGFLNGITAGRTSAARVPDWASPSSSDCVNCTAGRFVSAIAIPAACVQNSGFLDSER